MSGRVQGVWFRQSCAEVAKHLGVTGWVRNRPDGRVEAVFEGDETVVEEIVTWCYQGPPRAVVSEVEVVSEDPEGSVGFSVI
ncbi:MAG TPA: acylphosphatase [Acidimicrobiales bacterium]